MLVTLCPAYDPLKQLNKCVVPSEPKNKQLKQNHPPKIKTDVLASSAIIYCPNMIINMYIFYTSVKAFMYLCSKTLQLPSEEAHFNGKW